MGHANIITFLDNAGKVIRPFSCLEEMEETMIERHNAIVKPNDRVYFLGDVAMNRGGLLRAARFNGKKVLIKGNHDILKLKDYVGIFEDIRSYKVYPTQGIICSHIPIYAGQMEEKARWKFNVHGHTHANFVTKEIEYGSGIGMLVERVTDERYLNICVEQTNYTPLSFDEILATLGIEKNIGQFKVQNKD